jgi:hypothetical protein
MPPTSLFGVLHELRRKSPASLFRMCNSGCARQKRTCNKPASSSIIVRWISRFWPGNWQGRSRWRGGRFACTSLIRRWSLEQLTVARYDDVNMDSDFSSISMSINNGLLKQLLSIQQLPTQSRFKSHSSARPPQTPAASS